MTLNPYIILAKPLKMPRPQNQTTLVWERLSVTYTVRATCIATSVLSRRPTDVCVQGGRNRKGFRVWDWGLGLGFRIGFRILGFAL